MTTFLTHSLLPLPPTPTSLLLAEQRFDPRQAVLDGFESES